MNKSNFFKKENLQNSSEKLSPSGNYKLVVESFGTGKNTWNYTQGTVYNVNSDKPIATIQRNYSAFPFEWIEDHPNGHDYLVGGEDYQGQTVIELDTGNRRDLLPEEAAKGHGFCWASYKYIKEHQLLMVCGCYWACPYEFRFYDFSDPMNGWAHLEVEGDEYNYIDDSQKEPTISNDGTITTYKTVEELDFEDYDCDPSDIEWEKPERGYDDEKITVVATKTYKIKDNKLIFQSEHITDVEKAYREKCRIAQEKYEAWKRAFRES